MRGNQMTPEGLHNLKRRHHRVLQLRSKNHRQKVGLEEKKARRQQAEETAKRREHKGMGYILTKAKDLFRRKV